jgi:hypothetical protein
MSGDSYYYVYIDPQTGILYILLTVTNIKTEKKVSSIKITEKIYST